MNELLSSLNFSTTEIEIYEDLLTNSPSTIVQISKRIKVARSTVHHNVEKLKELGFVNEMITKKGRVVIAQEPSIITNTLNRKMKILKAQENELKLLKDKAFEIVPKISFISPSVSPDVDFKVYEGVNSVSALYDEILTADWIKSYANISKIIQVLPENHTKFTKAIERGAEIHDIIVEDSMENKFKDTYKKYQNNKIKFFPKQFDFQPMDYLITENAIYIVSLKTNLQAIVIKDSFQAYNAKILFDLLWSFLPELE